MKTQPVAQGCLGPQKRSAQITKVFALMKPTQNKYASNAPYFRQFGGKYFVTGFFTTFSSFWPPSEPRIENLCNSCTIRPQNRLNVRGIRIWGLISMSTFYTIEQTAMIIGPLVVRAWYIRASFFKTRHKGQLERLNRFNTKPMTIWFFRIEIRHGPSVLGAHESFLRLLSRQIGQTWYRYK